MLDLKSIFLYSAVINFCTVAAVTLGWFRSSGRGDMRFWLLAAWLMLFGAGLMAAGDYPLFPGVGYVGGFAHMASMGFLLLGFKEFFGLSYHRLEAVAVALVACLGIALSRSLTDGAFDGVWLLYVGSGANLLMVALAAWRGKPGEMLPSRRLAVLVTAAYALGNFCVAPFAYFYPVQFVDGTPSAWWLEASAIPLTVCNAVTYLLVLVLKLERATESQRYLATHDMLTGVLNRRAFHERLAAFGERSGTIAVMDLDHFKAINDSHGHQGGDDVLKAFARCVEERMPAGAVFGRTGGEEFALCLPDFGAARAAPALEALRRAVEALDVASPKDGRIAVTMSCGYSTFQAGSWAIDQTMAEADNALYHAKNCGRNRVEAYAPGTWLKRCIEDTLAVITAATRV